MEKRNQKIERKLSESSWRDSRKFPEIWTEGDSCTMTFRFYVEEEFHLDVPQVVAMDMSNGEVSQRVLEFIEDTDECGDEGDLFEWFMQCDEIPLNEVQVSD